MLSMWVRRGVCVGFGLVSVATASAASAREPAASEAGVSPRGSGHEALQLTLKGSLVSYVKQTVKLKDLEGSDSPDLKTSTTTFAALAVRVLFSLGLSGWIDTAGEPTPPPPSPSFEPPPPATVLAPAPN